MRENLRVMVGLLVAVAMTGTAMADVISLQDLMDSGTPLVSYDGTVEFSNFTYTPTVGAPDAASVNIITDDTLPNGIQVQGAFQAFNGAAIDVLFGFDAAMVSGMDMTEASLELVSSFAEGVVADPYAVSGVTINETISAGAESTDLLVWDAAEGTDRLMDTETLVGFGPMVTVLKDIGVTTVAVDGAESTAGTSLFTQAFVPEPATWALLAATPALVLLRRRR